MEGFVDAAAAHVLSNNEILMSAPSNAKLSGFYPNPSESTNTIAQAVCNSGQLFVRANSKSFSSASDFQVSTANILDAPLLTMRIQMPAATTFANEAARQGVLIGSYNEGWGYDLIESLEISYSNSNISNLIVTGQALRDWSLLQCKNEDERRDLLQTAGRLQFGDRNAIQTFQATVPISFLNWRGAGGVKGGFPIDARTLNGSIQFQFRFRPLTAAIGPLASAYVPGDVPEDRGTGINQYSGGVITANFPVEFSDLELTFRTYQLMDSAFSVAHALQANPGMIYSIPSQWINTYRYTIDIDDSLIWEQQLNSAPAGMIQAILISIRPIARATPGTTLDWDFKKLNTVENVDRDAFNIPHYFSLPLDELRLQYSGQSIFDAHTREQLNAFYKFIFCDDLITPIASWPQSTNMTDVDGVTNFPKRKGIRYQAPLHMIPLMHDGNSVFRHRHFENLPHYSGSTLSLRGKLTKFPIYKTAPYANDALIASSDAPLNMDQEQSTGSATNLATVQAALTPDVSPMRIQTIPKETRRIELLITYVVASLLQSTNGVVELQL